MSKTAIGWATLGLSQGNSTNPIRAVNIETGKQGHYCKKIGPGCAACYASGWQVDPRGYGTGLEYIPENRDKVEIRWEEKAGLEPFRKKTPMGWFPCDMTDWLGYDFRLPISYSYRVLAMCAIAPWHRHLLLTKRPDELRRLVAGNYNQLVADQINELGLDTRQWAQGEPTPFQIKSRLHLGERDVFEKRNIWLGFSICCQADLTKALPNIRAIYDSLITHTRIRPLLVVSYEPALEEVDWHELDGLIDFMIIGGESDQRVRGKKVHGRPFDPRWADKTYDWCQSVGIKMYYKQTGNTVWLPIDTGSSICPGDTYHFGENAGTVISTQSGRALTHFQHKYDVPPQIDGNRIEEFPIP